MNVEWVKTSQNTESCTPSPGVNILIYFEDNRYSGHEYKPPEELDCWYWQLWVASVDGRELFAEASGEYDYRSRRFMSLSECKEDALAYYSNRLKSAVAGDLSRAREDERNLSEAMHILEGVTVF